MRELFEAIDNCEAGSVNMVLTVWMENIWERRLWYQTES